MKIALQTNTIQSYQQIKSNLIEDNILFNEKANIYTDEMVEIEKQYKKYKIIRLNSDIQSKFQDKFFDTVKRFQKENE